MTLPHDRRGTRQCDDRLLHAALRVHERRGPGGSDEAAAVDEPGAELPVERGARRAGAAGYGDRVNHILT